MISNIAFSQQSDSVKIELEKPTESLNKAITDTVQHKGIFIDLDCGILGYLGISSREQNYFQEQFHLGVGIAYQTSPYVELGALIFYHRLTYDKSYDPNMESFYPFFIVTSANPNGSGRMYEVSGKIRLFLSLSNVIQPYLFFQFGNYWTTFPGITYTILENNIPHTYYQAESKESSTYFGGGFGLKFHVSKSMAIRAEINSSYGEVLYIGLNFAVQYAP
jgi:hypothetical protein